jgi:hypothetical protein
MMIGDPDPVYVQARAALLDAAEALTPHLDSIVLVGAQAVYLHTGSADLAVAEFTTDADFSLDPTDLGDSPLIDSLLRAKGFLPREHPGGWTSPTGIYVDLMVPEALAGFGRRSADLGLHGKRVARRALGLEGVTFDCSRITIPALDPADGREVTMNVAGPSALLVAKLHKLGERVATNDRVKAKDALDVFRILRAIQTQDLALRFVVLRSSPNCQIVTETALILLRNLFGDINGEGVLLACRATERLMDPSELAQSAVYLTHDLLDAVDRNAK